MGLPQSLRLRASSLVALTFAATLLAVASSAEAQSEPPSTVHGVFGVGTGPDFPVSGSTQTDRVGANILAEGGYRFSNRFSLLGDFLISLHPVPGTTLIAAHQPSGVYTYMSLLVDPRFVFARRGAWSGYVLGGGGYSLKLLIYQLDTGIDQGDGTTTVETGRVSTNQTAVDFGAGFSRRLHGSPMSFFAEVRYQHAFNPIVFYSGITTPGGSSMIPLIIGFRTGGGVAKPRNGGVY